jgi:hypothetical protein
MVRSLAILAASSWLALLAEEAAGADPVPTSTASSPASAAPPPAAHAGTDTAPVTDAAPTTEAPAAASAADTTEPSQPVKEVTLDPTVKPPVCRRYVPTGSRIATERCQSAEVTDASVAAERDQARRDIDEMRMRQATRDQARAAAQAEALRQRAGGF